MDKPIEEIPQFNQVVARVCEMVRSCESELIVTHLLQEPSKLPREYRRALREKLTQGLKVIRYCFGDNKRSKNQAQLFDERIELRYVKDASAYQRLIIADRRQCCFKVGESFFYSQDSLIIESFCRYITQIAFRRSI